MTQHPDISRRLYLIGDPAIDALLAAVRVCMLDDTAARRAQNALDDILELRSPRDRDAVVLQAILDTYDVLGNDEEDD